MSTGLTFQPGVTQLAAATNQFSLELYHNLIGSKPQSSNVFFSPFSITAALAMVTVGAQGTTRDQVLDTLHMKSNFQESLNRAFDQLFTDLNVETTGNSSAAQEVSSETNEVLGLHTEPAQMKLANRVYIQEGFTVKQAFARTLEIFYHSTFGQEDFRNLPQVATNDINSWIANVTNGKITDMFSGFDPATTLVLVSAIYFKAGWQNPFSDARTTEDNFFLSNGTSVKCQFMRNVDEYQFAEFQAVNATALLLPYTNDDFHLVVILPNQKAEIASFQNTITSVVFDLAQYARYQVNVSLPKFSFEDKYDLKETLIAMGIKDLFSSNADLSGISDQPLAVSSVAHKAFVAIDEKGTEAAAATGVTIVTLSAAGAPLNTKDFNADHPFLFYIQHKHSGIVLFLGKMESPTL